MTNFSVESDQYSFQHENLLYKTFITQKVFRSMVAVAKINPPYISLYPYAINLLLVLLNLVKLYSGDTCIMLIIICWPCWGKYLSFLF